MIFFFHSIIHYMPHALGRAGLGQAKKKRKTWALGWAGPGIDMLAHAGLNCRAVSLIDWVPYIGDY